MENIMMTIIIMTIKIIIIKKIKIMMQIIIIHIKVKIIIIADLKDIMRKNMEKIIIIIKKRTKENIIIN